MVEVIGEGSGVIVIMEFICEKINWVFWIDRDLRDIGRLSFLSRIKCVTLVLNFILNSGFFKYIFNVVEIDRFYKLFSLYLKFVYN